jgi:hypothetical protein
MGLSMTVTLSGEKHIRLTMLAVRTLINRIEVFREPGFNANDVAVLEQVLAQLGETHIDTPGRRALTEFLKDAAPEHQVMATCDNEGAAQHLDRLATELDPDYPRDAKECRDLAALLRSEI